MFYILAVFNSILISIGQLFLKKSSMIVSTNFIDKLMNIHFIIGIITYGLSTLLWIVILGRIKISVAYPIMSLSYVFVMIGSKVFFGEVIKNNQILGMALILIGVYSIVK